MSRGSYARLDGRYWRHPKTVGLPIEAVGVHALMVSYCADAMTDGRVPKKALRGLLGEHCGNKRGRRAVASLLSAGLLHESETDLVLHDWADHNITSKQWKKQKEDTANRVRRHRKCNALRGPLPLTQDPRPKTQDPLEGLNTPDSSRPAEPAGVTDPSLADLESRYEPELIADARQACALRRTSGEMKDSVWRKTLLQLAAHPPEVASEAMRTFAENHGDGEKDERYMLGIARRMAKGKRRGPAPPAKHEEFRDDPIDFGEVANG